MVLYSNHRTGKVNLTIDILFLKVCKIVFSYSCHNRSQFLRSVNRKWTMPILSSDDKIF